MMSQIPTNHAVTVTYVNNVTGYLLKWLRRSDLLTSCEDIKPPGRRCCSCGGFVSLQ